MSYKVGGLSFGVGLKRPLNTQIQDVKNRENRCTRTIHEFKDWKSGYAKTICEVKDTRTNSEVRDLKVAIFHNILAKPAPDPSRTLRRQDLCSARKPEPENVKYVPENFSVKLEDHYVVFLDPLQAKGDIVIECITAIVFESIYSEKGEVKIEPKDRLMCLGGRILNWRDEIESGWIYNRRSLEDLHADILETFKKGVAQRSPEKIGDALVKALTEIKDFSLGENKASSKVLEFF